MNWILFRRVKLDSVPRWFHRGWGKLLSKVRDAPVVTVKVIILTRKKIRYRVLYYTQLLSTCGLGLNAFHTHLSPILVVESSIWVYGERTMTLGATGLYAYVGWELEDIFMASEYRKYDRSVARLRMLKLWSSEPPLPSKVRWANGFTIEFLWHMLYPQAWI